MRKAIFFIAIAFICSLSGFAQPLKRGEHSLGLGIGVPAITNFNFTSQNASVTAFYDYGYTDKLGVGYISAGALLSIAGADYEYRYLNAPYTNDYNYVVVGPRVAYHFDMAELTKNTEWNSFDLYGGLFIGARLQTLKYTNLLTGKEVKDNSTKLATDIFAGIRYAISNKVGAFAEVGFGVSYLSLGANVRF